MTTERNNPSRPAARRVRWLATLAFVAASAALFAQTSAPASHDALPADIAAGLQSLEDDAFHFDQPGFYQLLAYVNTQVRPISAPTPIADWRTFIERPSDLRGVPVEIEGLVGRSKKWRPLRAEYESIGPVWQVELTRRDQPIACTLILTEPADDVPIGATIRVSGYFAMIRQYYGPSNRPQRAALLVGQAPTEIITTGPAPTDRGGSQLIQVAVLCAGLLIVWFFLRRRTHSRPHASGELHAEHAAPFSVADDAQAWALDEETARNAGSSPPSPDEDRPQ